MWPRDDGPDREQKGVHVCENDCVRRNTGVKRIDKQRMEALMVVVEAKESFKNAGNVESMEDERLAESGCPAHGETALGTQRDDIRGKSGRGTENKSNVRENC